MIVLKGYAVCKEHQHLKQRTESLIFQQHLFLLLFFRRRRGCHLEGFSFIGAILVILLLFEF